MDALAFGLTYGLPAIGAALGVGFIGAAALNALGRNAEKLAEIRTLMITAIIFADSLAIIGIVVAIVAKLI